MTDPQDDTPEREQELDTSGLLAAAPALARLAVHAGWRTAGWTAGSSVRAGGRVLDAARSGQPPTELLAQAGAEARDYALKLLGLAEARGGGRAAHRGPVGRRRDPPAGGRPGGPEVSRAPSVPAARSFCASRRTCATRRRPTRPTSASSTSWPPTTPASCASCSARVLSPRSMCAPACDRGDLRDGGARAVAHRRAGRLPLPRPRARIPEQPLPARPDLVLREAIADPLEYQVLEAQPKVTEAMEASGRARPSAAAST